jgi:hypothetical protein
MEVAAIVPVGVIVDILGRKSSMARYRFSSPQSVLTPVVSRKDPDHRPARIRENASNFKPNPTPVAKVVGEAHVSGEIQGAQVSGWRGLCGMA